MLLILFFFFVIFIVEWDSLTPMDVTKPCVQALHKWYNHYNLTGFKIWICCRKCKKYDEMAQPLHTSPGPSGFAGKTCLSESSRHDLDKLSWGNKQYLLTTQVALGVRWLGGLFLCLQCALGLDRPPLSLHPHQSAAPNSPDHLFIAWAGTLKHLSLDWKYNVWGAIFEPQCIFIKFTI